MSNNYYYFISGLPDLSISDAKPPYTTATFKTMLNETLSKKESALTELFFLKYDNKNLIPLLLKKEYEHDDRAVYTQEELTVCIHEVKENGTEISSRYPSYMRIFIQAFLEEQIEKKTASLENEITALYFDYALKKHNTFIKAWFTFNMNLNNILAASITRKYELNTAFSFVGENDIVQLIKKSSSRDFGLSRELDYAEKVFSIMEENDFMARERRIDALKWVWLDENTFFDYFTTERIWAYMLKLEMLERWTLLDKENGVLIFRELIKTLKSEVEIPTELIKK